MKRIFICGDSFATPDPEYGPMWVDILQTQLGSNYCITNTSSVSASNTLVAVQVDQAIRNQADYIIMLATACTRSEALVKPATDQDLMTRFQDGELVSYSIFRPYRSVLLKADQDRIYNFHHQYSDLELNIFRDHAILLGTLYRLEQSGIPYQFDQGGFEHPSFGGRRGYFAEFEQQRSQYCLWDYGNTQDERPYYHVKELQVHQRIADYYAEQILNTI